MEDIPFGDLIDKRIKIPEINTQHFDYSNEYTVDKNGTRVLKAKLVEEIRIRLEQG